MKKHKNKLLTSFSIGVIALFVFIAYKSNQSSPKPIDSAEQSYADEYILVSEILKIPETFAAEEEPNASLQYSSAEDISLSPDAYAEPDPEHLYPIPQNNRQPK